MQHLRHTDDLNAAFCTKALQHFIIACRALAEAVILPDHQHLAFQLFKKSASLQSPQGPLPQSSYQRDIQYKYQCPSAPSGISFPKGQRLRQNLLFFERQTSGGGEGKHHAFQPLLLRKLFCQIDQRTMPLMQTIKVPQSHSRRLALPQFACQ